MLHVTRQVNDRSALLLILPTSLLSRRALLSEAVLYATLMLLGIMQLACITANGMTVEIVSALHT